MPTAGAATAASEALPTLAAGAAALRRRSHRDLADLAAACRRSLLEALPGWVEASVASKGWTAVAPSRAEEWASGPLPVARFLHLLQDLHEGLARGRLPAPKRRPGPRSTSSFQALPAAGLADPLLLRGHRAHVHCASMAGPQEPQRAGDVALVLGAGNVTATPPSDALDQVFLRGRAVLLKLSPQHSDLLPHFGAALAPLVRADLLRLCCGDGAFGERLAHHEGVAAVHLTGAAATWAQLCGDSRLREKHLTAEVGCCTPAFVVPGRWRARELRSVAAQLAAYVATNGGATCLAPRLLLLAAAWPQREEFLHGLRAALATHAPRIPFHGAARAHFAAAAGRAPPGEALPPTLRSGLDPGRDRLLLSREHFAPVLLEMPLAGGTAAAWLDAATGYVKDHAFGALSAYVFAPPRLLARERAAIDAAIDALPHGTVAVNGWTGLGYGLGSTPWGVPQHAPLAHGRGWTRGTLCLPDVRQVTVEAPFRPRPLPPWLPAHRRGQATLRALCRHYLAPSWAHLLATLGNALAQP